MPTSLLLSTWTLGQGWRSGAYYLHPWFFFGFIPWLIPLLVFGVLVFLVARWLKSGREDSGYRRGTNNNAVRILEERYAKGEITKEQFEQMRKEIQG